MIEKFIDYHLISLM